MNRKCWQNGDILTIICHTRPEYMLKSYYAVMYRHSTPLQTTQISLPTNLLLARPPGSRNRRQETWCLNRGRALETVQIVKIFINFSHTYPPSWYFRLPLGFDRKHVTSGRRNSVRRGMGRICEVTSRRLGQWEYGKDRVLFVPTFM
jgi:hypothetical protein